MSARRSKSTAAKVAVTGLLAGGAVVSPAASLPAAAAQGNWVDRCRPYSGWHGGCMLSNIATSSSRNDSDFANDYNYGSPLNDHVSYVRNDFSTTDIQAFRNRDYDNGSLGVTSCVAVGTQRGPYNAGGGDVGLSSFKTSCA